LDTSSKAWLSGFVDGEGHVGLHPTGKYYQACCFIRNTHYETMVHVSVLLKELLGRDVSIGHETRSRGKDSYYVNVQSYSDLKLLAETLRPYAITKQQQWDLVSEYVESRLKLTGHKRPHSVRELEIISQMSLINKRWTEGD
jgi:hypothetical protein